MDDQSQDEDVEMQSPGDSSSDSSEAPLSDSESEFSFSGYPLPPPAPPPTVHVIHNPSPANVSNKGLQRSIALILKQVGFDSATPLALDAFAHHAELYMERLIRDIQTFSHSARRNIPTPVDFQLALEKQGTSVESMKQHRKHNIDHKLLIPKTENEPIYESYKIPTSLSLLHPDLSGESERKKISYIPAHFPEFPSIHTFRYTPHIEKKILDPKHTRSAAALAAKQGEDALRGLVRAAKVRKQKEVRTIVQRDQMGRERYKLWEAAMQKLLRDKDSSRNKQTANSQSNLDPTPKLSDQDIADASMIVNSLTAYARQELPKSEKKTLPNTGMEIPGQ